MSRETVLTIQPGESAEDFISRVVNTAPEPSGRLIDRVRTLLAADAPAAIPMRRVPTQSVRAAA